MNSIHGQFANNNNWDHIRFRKKIFIERLPFSKKKLIND